MINVPKAIRHAGLAALAALGLAATPLAAQVETIDPNDALTLPIDGDLDGETAAPEREGELAPREEAAVYPAQPPAEAPATAPAQPPQWSEHEAASAETAEEAAAEAVEGDASTYREDDLIGAAEGVFGQGAEGVARMIQNLLAEQGEPNAYIVGREAGGAFVVGARYGSGTLYHKVQGEHPVYWTGPSVGFDAGANAGSTFVLVYNLHDLEELYERYPSGEGQAYLVGGLTASYLRKGDVVLIPIRMGAGLRLGVNAGYMRFSKKQRWLPF